MSRRKTAGKRMARKWWDTPTIDIDGLGLMIDRAIRRAQAKAWDDAVNTVERVRSYVTARNENPYRWGAKR